MNPNERIKRHAQLAAASAILVWGLLCFFILLSPRFARLNRVNAGIGAASMEVAAMKKEIEDASIAGPPVEGLSRFEKFGILGSDEEQLFLSDLIEFCKETKSTLNLVRRSGVARRVRTSTEEERGKKPASASQEVPQPTIARVPHTVSYSGSFLSSFYLLRRLESYRRLLTVERIEVATDNQFGYPRVNGTITVDLYLVTSMPPLPPTKTAATGEAHPASG